MIKYLSSPFRWFFKLEAASGLILLISAILALIISKLYLAINLCYFAIIQFVEISSKNLKYFLCELNLMIC